MAGLRTSTIDGSAASALWQRFLGCNWSLFSWVNGAYSFTTLYRMLQNKDIAQILAQPRLVVKNGKSGGFLAGGEVPIISSTANTFNVIYKPFGVRLDFIPTITLSDRIDLRVFPEVSEVAAGSGTDP